MDSHCDYIDPIDVDQDFIEETLNGHNGMRNRYADILRVSNMIKLEWDKELVAMAELWLARCHNYEIDPCALLDNVGKFFHHTNIPSRQHIQRIYSRQRESDMRMSDRIQSSTQLNIYRSFMRPNTSGIGIWRQLQ